MSPSVVDPLAAVGRLAATVSAEGLWARCPRRSVAQHGQPLTLTAEVNPWLTSIQDVDVTYTAQGPGGPLNPQSAGGNTMTVQVPGSPAWPAGQEVRYTWTVTYRVALASGTQTTMAQGSLVMTEPKPVLSHPANGATGVPTTVPFEWNAVPGARYYNLVVDNRTRGNRAFMAWIEGTNNTLPLESQTEYRWYASAVFAVDAAGTSYIYGPDTTSPTFRFTTQ